LTDTVELIKMTLNVARRAESGCIQQRTHYKRPLYIKFACHWVSMEIKEKSQQSSYLSHSVSSASILITSKPTGILQVGLEVRLYGLNNSK